MKFYNQVPRSTIRHSCRLWSVSRTPTGKSACLSSYIYSHSYSTSADHVKIVDVSPRDGLQNEKSLITTETKLELIERLTNTGLKYIESTAFVSPKWVPQMADAKEVLQTILPKYRGNGVCYPVLVPNVKGLERTIEASNGLIEEIAIFGASSQGFSMKNTNTTIEKGLLAFKGITELARSHNIRVRGYLSTVIACPYDGPTKPSVVAALAEKYFELGCYELSLGDTIGVGTPGHIEALLKEVLKAAPVSQLAIHAHDTYGQGVANVVKAVEMGIRVVDSSVGGLGGCPYAKGASGNVATEDVVYALHGLGLDTGVDIMELSKTGAWITSKLNRPNGAKAGPALLANQES